MILGLLYKTKKKRALAVQRLGEARRILSQFGQTPMLARVETALAELAFGSPHSTRMRQRPHCTPPKAA